jgi:hypothetical protein
MFGWDPYLVSFGMTLKATKDTLNRVRIQFLSMVRVYTDMASRAKDAKCRNVRFPAIEEFVGGNVTVPKSFGGTPVSNLGGILVGLNPEGFLHTSIMQKSKSVLMGSAVEAFCYTILLRRVGSRCLMSDTFGFEPILELLDDKFATTV